MAQPSAVKNWEAQQRTNTVLAQSIKQLKDDFTAIKELLEWKAEVEEQINGMMDEMDTMRTNVKQVQLKRQQSNVSQMWGKVSQRVMNIVRGDPEKSGKVHDADNLPAAQTSPPKDRVEVVTLVLLVISLAIQGALAVPIGVWAYEGSIEANSRHISLFLGCSGAIMAVFGILSLFQLRRWQISIFTAFQPWVVALGVIYLATYIKDLVKLQEICEGEDTGACPTLIDDASARISYGTGIVFFTTLNSIFMNIKKDALVINDVIMKLPMRVRMMMGPAGVGAGGGGSVTAGVARGPSQNLGKMGSSLAMLAGASQKGLAVGDNKTKMLYARMSSKQIVRTNTNTRMGGSSNMATAVQNVSTVAE